MRKNIIFNITKHVKVDESPFGIVIYIHKDRNCIFVEDMVTGKCIQASSYDIGKYLKLDNVQTEWKRSFNHSYTRMQNSNTEYFMPLYMETNKFATLSFDIVSRLKPDFRTKRVPNPSDVNRHRGREINMVNNGEEEPDRSGGTGNHLKTYNELYEKVKDFETDNFKLIMIANEKEKVYDENFKLINSPHITCKLPMFQIYTLLIPTITTESKILFGYRQELTVIKIKDRFYRFPYGNISSNDHMCLGNHSYSYSKTQPDSIQDAAYAGIITSVFNGDYNPNIKFNNQIPSCFDIDILREKVKHDDFEFSFMDALFYLSQCESIEDLNLNMFILTPSIPKPISDFERKLLNKPQDEDDEPIWYQEETTEDLQNEDRPADPIRNPEAGFERGNIGTVEEIRVRDELRDHAIIQEPPENHQRYYPGYITHTAATATTIYTTDEIRNQQAQNFLENLTGEQLRECADQVGFNLNQTNIPGLHEIALRFVSPGPIEAIPLNFVVGEQIRTDVPQPQNIPINDSTGVQDGQHFDGEGRLVTSVEELHEQALDQQLQAQLPQDITINNHDIRTIYLTEALASHINNTEGEENDTNRESTDTN